ncbi:transducin beta protein 3 like [Trichuris trichiura]|uniref:Transducin beta protein 3 like n=1 Tax=Trichuris trichiura TaxID=36087 RepID=A0A077ZDG5_TRITR|nr:transducin beta protein 3 like [Trichuris trichiura]
MHRKEVGLEFAVTHRFLPFFSGGSVAVSADNRKLFTTCGNVIKVVDLDSSEVKYTIGDEENDPQVTCFSLDANGRLLIVAHENLLLRSWSLDNDVAVISKSWKVGGRGPIQRLVYGRGAFSYMFATGASDGSVKLWDMQQQTCIGSVRSATSNSKVAFGCDTGALWMWQPNSQMDNVYLRYHSAAVTSLISNDVLLFSGSRDKTIAVWDLKSLELKRSIPAYEAVESLILLNTSNGTFSKRTACVQSRVVQLIGCKTNESCFAVTEDENFHLFNCSDLKVTKQLVGNNSIVNDVASLSDDHFVVATNSADIRVYNVATGHCQLVSGHTDIVLCVSAPKWSTSLFLSSSKDNTARIWRFSGIDDIHCVCVITGHTRSVSAAHWSNQKLSFCISASEDTTVKIFRLKKSWFDESSKMGEPISLKASVTQVAHSNNICCIAISPNDRLAATGSMDKTVKLWTIDQECRLRLSGTITDHKRGVWDVRFSHVDQVLATASGDRTVKMFSLPDLNCVKTFEGHETAVLRVLFNQNGSYLLSGDTAGLIKLWDIKTSVCLKTYEAHEGKLWALEFSKKDKNLISGGEDGALLIWKDVTEDIAIEREKKRQEAIQQDQTLSNLMQQKRYVEAFVLALTLRRPRATLDLLRRMTLEEGDPLRKISITLEKLPSEHMQTLISFAIEWNTSSRTCHFAQLIISNVLKRYTPEEVLQWPNAKTLIGDLLPYTIRHFERLSRFREDVACMNFICKSMRFSVFLITQSY